MKKSFLLIAAGTLLSSPALALELKVGGITEGGRIPDQFSFCVPDGKGKTKPGGNINPEIRWSGAPEGTKSFALVVVDPDVPTKFDDANQDGKTIAEDFPRQHFYHWVLADIPASRSLIKQGEASSGISEGGKPVGKTAYGINGQNDYASFMKGTYGGYDGPCPPWNDARMHHYHFTLYALKVETLGLTGAFTGKQALQAIEKNSLAKAEVVGTFSNKR